jgi:hypothetical protein
LLCSRLRAIGLGSKLIIVTSVIEQPRPHGLGCRPFPDPPGSSSLPPIIGRWVRRYLSAPSHKKRVLPFHLTLPRNSAVLSGLGVSYSFAARKLNQQASTMNEPLRAETRDRDGSIAAQRLLSDLLLGAQNACDWLVEKKPNLGVGTQRDAIDTCID